MALNNAVKNDLDATASLMVQTGSPKTLYTAFLLGLIREYFSIVLEANVDKKQMERGFAALVAFVPDKVAREAIWNNYIELRDDETNTTNASIRSCGMLVDYLSDCLDLTESAEGAFI